MFSNYRVHATEAQRDAKWAKRDARLSKRYGRRLKCDRLTSEREWRRPEWHAVTPEMGGPTTHTVRPTPQMALRAAQTVRGYKRNGAPCISNDWPCAPNGVGVHAKWSAVHSQ